MTKISSSPKKLIYISIKNYFPSIDLHTDNLENDKNRIPMLANIGATLNIGNLQYHLWVKYQYPEIVVEYLQSSKNTVYNIVHLLTTLGVKDTNQDVIHGKITTVIWHKTQFILQGREPFYYFAYFGT